MLPDDDLLVVLVQRRRPWVYGYSPTSWKTRDGEAELVKASRDPRGLLAEANRRAANAPGDVYRCDFELGALSNGKVIPIGKPWGSEDDMPPTRQCLLCGKEQDRRAFVHSMYDPDGQHHVKYSKLCRTCKNAKARAGRRASLNAPTPLCQSQAKDGSL